MPLIIGMGREGRGDDAAGLRAVRLVRALLWPQVRIAECAGDAPALLETWAGEEAVIVIDAMSSASAPGTVRRFDAGEGPLPTQLFRVSTHALGLAEAVELARSMGQLPASLVLYGIEGRTFAAGARLSYPVECALRDAALQVTEEVLTRWGIRPPGATT